MRKSRLKRKTDKKNITTIFLSVLGIIIVFIILIKFGLALLVNFSLLISSGKNQNQQSQNVINFIPPPILNTIVSATNSAKVKITGKATKEFTIDLYINNQNVNSSTVDDKGNFSFDGMLKEGENQVKVIAVNNNKKSDFSNTLTILLKTSKPQLNIISPTDGQSFKKDQNSVNVSGSTDPGTNVTVNGFWAVIDENNNFSYILPLQNGDNQIKILTTDQAGNQTEKDLKVNYSQ